VEKLVAVVFVVIGVIAVAAGVGLLFAYPVKWCWNYTIVHIWELPAITWGQAWCLSFLSGTLIKSQQYLKKE
jgi:hypothetical protein